MIDWVSVGFGGLWIFGLSLALAAVGIANFLAGENKECFRQALERPACRNMFDLGLVCFCLGWAGGAPAIWERLLWVILASLFVLQRRQAGKMGKL